MNDLVESVIYSSVIYGGLNDIDALKALYKWLFSEREIYKIKMPAQTDILSDNAELLALIPLTINDDNYGCAPYKSNTLEDLSNDSLQRYVEYIPDDITLSFLYALKNQKLGNNKIDSFETIISNISKKLKLQNKDINKPHLSQFVRYANYHWRQIEGIQIDNASSVVKQGIVKTTGLSTDRVLNYNQEVINSDPEPLIWSDLFNAAYKSSGENRGTNRAYPNFSKNLIKEVQDALKGTKQKAIDRIKLLQFEFPQPNAERLLGWVLSLLKDSNNRLNTISKYSGCIGRDWLMLTMDENLDDWYGEDFEEIYEQIVQNKIKDGRKEPILCKASEFDKDDIDNTSIDIADDEGETSKIITVVNDSISDNKASYLDKLKDTQKFTYGRLRAFHDYQRGHHDAPYVYFPWGNNRQVVKANMISPHIYNAMKEYLNSSTLELEQKRICLVILGVAYRTGMRINELIGIKVKDISDIYTDYYNQKVESPKILLRPNRYRKLKSDSAKRTIPIDCLLKTDELSQFIKLYDHQKRLRRCYLFSQGSGDQPLPHVFFSNLMKVMWDRLLSDHDFTFHSLRHTAISQLTVVLSGSPLAQVMTDYDVEHCDAIVKGILANNKVQGGWFGLATFAGHLTPETTFEHYIHTAYLLAGWQLSQSNLMLPLTVFQATTGINYQIVNRQDATAYDGTTKQIQLYKLRPYLLNKLAHNQLFTLSDITKYKEDSKFSQHTNDDDLIKNEFNMKPSIFVHHKYFDVIAFLEELQEINVSKREGQLAEVAIRHGISASEAILIYHRASQLFIDDRLLLGSPKGQKNQEILIRALDRAYQMSIEEPELLQDFVKIFSDKQNYAMSSIHFGIKDSQLKMLIVFLEIGCRLVDSLHWQIRSNSEQAVRDIKKELGLDSQIRTGARQNFHGYEVRVVQKKRKQSDKNLAITDYYYASSGILKYLGYLMITLIEN
ncbi:site-specific integrase [Psychrobacter immobilis]|uniref:site-specific integrase n=1 Tax=Psychrobacter immobilis TaxID=498 RepID=UPI00191B6096|nr:site-specific integrase [Psychrobacter immobilis]